MDETLPPPSDAETDVSVSQPSGNELSWEPLLAPDSSGDGASAEAAPAEAAPAEADAAAPAGPMTMEDAAVASKIREILFGQHMAAYERRFDQLEARVAREAAQLREDTVGRIDKLDERLSQEVDGLTRQAEGLARQVEDEREARAEEVSGVTDRFQAVREEIEASIEKASRDADASVVHLRHALQEETARQRRALDERTEELEEHIDAIAESLRNDKVDRASLRVLFEQLSVHFGNEPTEDPAV